MARSAQAQAALDRKKEYAQQMETAKLAGDLVRYGAQQNGTWGKSTDTVANAAREKTGKQTAQSLVEQSIKDLQAKAQRQKNKERAQKTQKPKADKIVEENTPESDTIVEQKRNAEEKLKELENADIDWTDTNARKEYEQKRKELQAQVDSAGATLAKEEDTKTISEMSEEDRKQLERYAVQQIDDQNKPVELAPGSNATLFLGLFGNKPNAVTGEDFTDLFGKVGGKTRADELSETYMREQNAELNEKAAEAGRNLANAGRNIDHSLLPEVSPYDVDLKPVTQAGNDFVAGTLASAASVPVNAVSGVVGTVGQLQSAARSTGRYPTLDPNATGTALQTYSSAIRGQVGDNLTGDVYDENGNLVKDGGLIGDTLNILYQAGMSAADSIARAYLGGGALGGKTLAGLNSFSQTMAEASEKGATPAQAALMATATAFIEAATEKYSLENLIATAKGKGAISTIKNIVRQAGIEMSEEEASLVGNLLAEAAILGDKSDFNQTVAALQENGMTEKEAKAQAWKNIWNEAVETAIVSGVSGAAGGLVSSLKGQTVDPEPTKTPEPLTEKQAWDSLYETSPEAQAATDAQKKRLDDILGVVKPEDTTPVETPAPTKADDIVNKTMEDIGLKKPETQETGKPDTPTAADSSPVTPQSTPQVGTSRTSADGGQPTSTPGETEPAGQTVSGDVDTSTVGKQSVPSGDYAKSKTFTNSGVNSTDADIRAAYDATMKNDPLAAKYEVKHNADTKATAQERTSSPERVRAEVEYLTEKTQSGQLWTPEDNVTSELAIASLMKDGSDEAANSIVALQKARQKNNTQAAQLVQSNAIIGTMKDVESPKTAMDVFFERMEQMDEKQSTYNPEKSGGRDYETWRADIEKNVTKMASAIDNVPDGDTAAMKAIIEDIAFQSGISEKHGQYGLSKRTKKLLSKVPFEDLKTLANAQIASMSDSFRKRDALEIAESTRKSAMLSAITTFERNLSGNTAIGLLDSASDSTTARIADGIISKFTGKQTVGNDIKNVKQYINGAKDAAAWASLCVELNVPVETDAMSTLNTARGGGDGGKYVGKTFNPNGNAVMRGLYAYQKFQAYELDVSDKVFEGGTKSAVSESLKNLKGLSADEQQRLADYTANRRTFKDATWTDADGDTHGAVASRAGQFVKNGAINLGEKAGEKVGSFFGEKGKEVGGKVGKGVTTAVANKVAPFVSVPTNVAQAGVDYSVGVVKGAAEMAAIIHDARKGIDIPVERQRQAASDFGRGVSGLGLIGIASAAARAGIIAVHNDDDLDKKSLEQSGNLSGAQINLSALGRLGEEGGEKWKAGDVLTSLDFLEPFNTHLYLGMELAQYDNFWEMAKHYPGSVYESSLQAFMDSPMVSGLQELEDDISSVMDGEKGLGDALAENVGEYASSYIPQIVRQGAQAMDGYYRDTRGDTKAETAFNQLIAGIPLLSQTLPKKVDGLGNEQERPGWLSIFLDPTKTKKYNPSEITQYLGTLSDKTEDTSFYPDRQAPMKIKIGGEEIPLDGTQRETYQKAYGDSVSKMYSALMSSAGFKNLPEETQIAALNKAKSYATEIAKASIAENPDAPEKSAAVLAQDIYKDTVTNQFSSAFKSITDDAKYGRDNADSVAALEQAYKTLDLLPKDMKEEIMNDSGGRVGYYVTAKKNGVSTETFLNMYDQYKTIDENKNLTTAEKAQDWAVALDKAERAGTLTTTQKKALKDKMVYRQSMVAETKKYDEMRENDISIENADRIIDVLSNVVGTGKVDKETGKASVRAIDKYTAITNLLNLSDSEIDAAMKVYMPDYDPEDSSSDKTYAKYEYVRRALGLSPEDFIDAYNVNLNGGVKNVKLANWENLGYSPEEASIFYRLFAATGKTKIDVRSWYNEQLGYRGSDTSTAGTSGSVNTNRTYQGETLPQGSLDDFERSLLEPLYGTAK